MALDLGVIQATVTLDDSDYNRRMNALPETAEKSFQTLAKLAATYLTAKEVSEFAANCVKSFSDMEEATNRFKAVYGSIPGTSENVSKQLQEDFNLSKQSANDMLASVGDILTGFGFAQRDALKFADAASRLGADLYSFTNYAGGAKGATEAITKAMLGETEQVKALGVVIRQESSEFQEMMAGYVAQGYTENQAKAMTALEMIKKQSINAIGDWNRPGQTTAQTMQMISENTKKATEALGEQIATGIRPGLNAWNSFLSTIAKASPEAIRLGLNVATLTAGLALLHTSVGKAANAQVLEVLMPLAGMKGPKWQGAIKAAEAESTKAAEGVKRAEEELTAAKRGTLLTQHEAQLAREARSQAQAAVQTAQANAKAAASDEMLLAIREKTSARRILLDKQEAASSAERALTIARNNLQEAETSAANTATGSLGAAKPSPELLRQRKEVLELEKQYEKAQQASATAAQSYDSASRKLLVTQNQGVTETTELAAAKKNLENADKAAASASDRHTQSINRQKAAQTSLTAAQTQSAAAAANLNTVSSISALSLRALSTAAKAAGAAMLSLGPIGVGLIAISALSALSDWIGSDLDRLSQKAKTTAEEARRASEALSEGNYKRDADQQKIDRIQELSKYESLNNLEKEEAIRLNQELSNSYGVQIMAIDEVTGRLKINTEAIKEYNRQMAERKRLEAKENVEAAQRALESAKAEMVARNRSSLTKNGAAGLRSGAGVWGMNEELLKNLSKSPKELDIALKQMRKPEERQEILNLISAYKNYQEALRKAYGSDEESKRKEADRMLKESAEKRKAMDSLSNTRYKNTFNDSSILEKERMTREKLDKLKKEQFAEVGNKKESDYTAEQLERQKKIVELEKELTDLARERADILRSLDQDEFSRRYKNASATGQTSLLEERRRKLEEELNASFQSRKVKPTTDVTQMTEEELKRYREILSLNEQIEDSRKKQRDVTADIAKTQWDTKFSLSSDNIEKNDMLEKRRKELEKKNSESFASRGFKDTGNVADYTAEELERYREILSIQQRIDELKKSAGDRSEQMNQRDADYERQKEIRLARRALDWKIDDLKDKGKTTEAKALLAGEYAKAKEEAAKAKATYEEIKRNTAGKILDENGTRTVEKAFTAYDEAQRRKEELEGRIHSEQKDADKGVKTAVAFSSEVLTAMLGDKTPEQETAKNTKEMVRQSRETNKKLDKISGGEVLG